MGGGIGRNQGQGDSPQGQEKQESDHEGCHGNAVAQVVDHEGDVVVQAVLPLLDRQTGTWADRGKGHTEGGTGPLVRATWCALTLRAEGLHGSPPCRAPTFGSLLLALAALGINGCGPAPTCHFRAGSEICQRWGRFPFLFNSGLGVATPVFSLSSDPSWLSN